MVDKDGRLVGVLGRSDMIKALKEDGPNTLIGDVVRATIRPHHRRIPGSRPLHVSYWRSRLLRSAWWMLMAACSA